MQKKKVLSTLRKKNESEAGIVISEEDWEEVTLYNGPPQICYGEKIAGKIYVKKIFSKSSTEQI